MQDDATEVRWATLPSAYLYALDQARFPVAMIIVLEVFGAGQPGSPHMHYSLLRFAVLMGVFICVFAVAAFIGQSIIYVGGQDRVCMCRYKRNGKRFVIGAVMHEFKYGDVIKCEEMNLWPGIGAIFVTTINEKVLFSDKSVFAGGLFLDKDDKTAQPFYGKEVMLDKSSTYITLEMRVDIDRIRGSDAQGLMLLRNLLWLLISPPGGGGILNKRRTLHLFCNYKLIELIVEKLRVERQGLLGDSADS